MARLIKTGKQGERGFTYLAVLFWVAIAGIGLAALGQVWSQDARRERETELEFRGGEYLRALASYRALHTNYPERLDDLLEDRNSADLSVKRHLRRLYPDPITGSPRWGLLIKDGQIHGVFSDSPLSPLRHRADVETYRDWQFSVDPPSAASNPAAAASSQPRSQPKK